MKNITPFFCLAMFIQLNVYSQTPLPFNYAFKIDGGFNTTYDITSDASGNVYATGRCSSSADMDPSNNTVLAGTSGLFVVKYSATGAYVWHKMISSPSGSSGYGLISGVRVGQNGNVILAGHYNGTLDFDPGMGQEIHESVLFTAGPDPSCDPEIEFCCEPEDEECNAVNTDDIFVMSLNSMGDFNWVNTYGGFQADRVEKVDIDSNNDIIAVANYENEIDIEGTTYNSVGIEEVLILKFDISGSLENSFILPTLSTAHAVTCDENGNFYVGTRFSHTVDFDPGPGFAYRTSNGSNDIAIVKFDSTSIFQWVSVIEGNQFKTFVDLNVDVYGDILGIGYFEGSADFDPSAGVDNRFSAGLTDTFILKINPAGNMTWVRTLEGVNSNYGIALTSNSVGDIFNLGYYKFTVDFNPGAPNFPIASNGEHDIYQLTLDKNGIFKGAWSYGDTFDDYGTTITSDPFDRVISAGWFANNSIDFDPSGASTVLSTTGNAAIFIQSLGTSNGMCPDNLSLNDLNSSTDYFASDYIEGQGIISSTAVLFQAANYVLLKPGFSVDNTSVFRAELGACP